MFERVLKSLVARVLSVPQFILAAALLTAAASVWLAFAGIKFQSSELELISTKLPLIAKSDRLDKFGYYGKTTFALVVRAPARDRAIEFMNTLVKKIHADPKHFQDVFYRIDPDEFKKWLLYYLDTDKLVHIKNTLEQNLSMVDKLGDDPDLLNFFDLVNRDMASRMVGELFTGFLGEKGGANSKEEKPMDLEFLIKVMDELSRYLSGGSKYVSPWLTFFKSGSWNLREEGYIWEGNKKFLMAAVVPAKVSGQVSSNEKSLAKLRAYIGELKESGFSDVEAGVTGQAALNSDEMSTALSDISRATWVSLLGVVLIMALFFRGLRHPIIIVLSLLVGLCWTFGWTAVFIGEINILSIVFAPMLCGLGVDYAIHWFARYEEERALSKGNRSAIIKSVAGKSGPAIFIAGLSTAASFLPFALTGFRALVELGLITGMGILFIILADFTVLPALSRYLASQGPLKGGPSRLNGKDLLRLSSSSARALLASALVLAVVGSIFASRVRFDLNPLRLQARSSESVYWEKLLVENSAHSIISAAAIADSAKEAVSESARFEALKTVSKVDNVFTLLPDNQEEKVPVLRSIGRMVPEPEPSIVSFAAGLEEGGGRLEANEAYKVSLIDVLERINFKIEPEQAAKWGASRPDVAQMAKVRDSIVSTIHSLENLPSALERLSEYRTLFYKDTVDQWSMIEESSSAPPMNVGDIPPQLKNQFLQGSQYLIRIYPKEPIWSEGALNRFVKDLRSIDPDVVGAPISLYAFATAFKKASIQASLYALISISLLLILVLRSVRLMLITLIPLLVGTIWTVGVMGAAGFDFNLANSIFMPLVVGAGVEYGIIIIQRWGEGLGGHGRLPRSTGKGVILAALTTTVGFGALMIAQNEGIFSLGFVAGAGSICVLAAALLIMPAVLYFMPDGKDRQGDP